MARPGLAANGNPLPGMLDHLEAATVEQLPALIGRDPRRLTVAELEALGHTKQPLLRVIRTNCIECCAGNEAEVRRCRLHHCPFWPYRMAANPFHRQELTEAERQERSVRLRRPRRLPPTPEFLAQKSGEAPAGTG